MTAKDKWNNDKQAFRESFNTKLESGYLYRGDTYNIEVPVDKTSKYIIPVDGILMHLLDYKDEPTEVKNTLTEWKPRKRRGGSGEGSTSTGNVNRRNPRKNDQVKSNKRISFRKIFVELPFDARLTYSQLGRRKTLRIISINCHPIISINSLLYLFSNNYFEKKPLSFRTWRSTWNIPGEAFPLNDLGELSVKMEAADQQTGDMSDKSSKTRGGGRQAKKSPDETNDTP
ncbi:MAG: hypothetical protein ACP5D6_09840 [Kosmotogaceae bacterium]